MFLFFVNIVFVYHMCQPLKQNNYFRCLFFLLVTCARWYGSFIGARLLLTPPRGRKISPAWLKRRSSELQLMVLFSGVSPEESDSAARDGGAASGRSRHLRLEFHPRVESASRCEDVSLPGSPPSPSCSPCAVFLRLD